MPSIQPFEIRGLDEIERRLQALPEKLRRKHLRTILRDGSELIRAEAEQKCPRAPTPSTPSAGHLADAIVKKVTVTNRYASARVGIDYSKVKHGHLVEFGTKPHKVGKRQHPGARRQPFMRPAFDYKGNEALNLMINNLKTAVEKEA